MDIREMDFGKNISSLLCDKDNAVLQMKDSTGEGVMTVHQVFPGVMVVYNDFHMETCFSLFDPQYEMLCIDHCREGRIEWELDGGSCLYVETGDMYIGNRAGHVRRFGFPLCHYHGVSVGFVVQEAAAYFSQNMPGFPADFEALQQKFRLAEEPFLVRSSPAVSHLFADLYSVPEALRLHCLRVQVLRVLLHINTLEEAPQNPAYRYFYKSQVNRVKQIMQFITRNCTTHYTLEELSQRFAIPLTSMKECFKGVYGTSIYDYVRSYRMNSAALRLRQTDETVAEVAAHFGYENASKFAAAFKKVIGATPTSYRHLSV
ncbi:MAG: helix-turn-helix domain-containing protein [Oscillospiraceae bacterium]